jgi:hypothetical protein
MVYMRGRPQGAMLNPISRVRSQSSIALRNIDSQPEAAAVPRDSTPEPGREGDPALARAPRRSASVTTSDMAPRRASMTSDERSLLETQPNPENSAPGRLGRVASAFWHGTNVREWGTVRAHDASFVRQVGGGQGRAGDVELGGGHTLQGIEAELETLASHLPALRQSDPALAKTLASSLQALQKHLRALGDGVPSGERLLKAAMNFAINWFPIVPPSPFMKNEPMTFAYTCAAAMNAMGMVGGSAASRAGSGWPVPFGGGVLGEQSNEAHLYPWIIGMQFLPSESIVKFAKDHANPGLAEAVEKFTGQTWWHAVLGVAAGAVLAQPLFGGLLANGVKSAYRKVAGPGRSHEENAAAAAARIGQATLDEIHGSLGRLREHGDALQDVRLAHSGGQPGAPEITRAMNTLVTLTLTEMATLAQRVEKRIGPAQATHAAKVAPPEQVGPAGAADAMPMAGRGVGKAETMEKFAYAAIAAVFSVYTIIAVQPEVIATIDLSADAGVLIMAMLAMAMSSAATAKDARSRLLNMASTTMTGAFAFTGDLIAKKGFPEKYPDGLMAKNPWIGAAAMMLMVALLPQHIANGVLTAGASAKNGMQRTYESMASLVSSQPEAAGVAATPHADAPATPEARASIEAPAATHEPETPQAAGSAADPAGDASAIELAVLDGTRRLSQMPIDQQRDAVEHSIPEHIAQMMLRAWESGMGEPPERGRILGEVDDDLPAMPA